MNYGNYLRKARLEASARLENEELARVETAARLLGISKGYLHKLENGEKKPSFEMLETLAERYAVQIGDLLPCSSPSGPEVDRIIAPLSILEGTARSRFIAQMSAFARMIASEIAATKDGLRDVEHSTSSYGMPYHPPLTSNRDEPHEGMVLLSGGESSAETTHAPHRTEATAARRQTRRARKAR